MAPTSTALSAACKSYVEDRRARKGAASANDAEVRFKRRVYARQSGGSTSANSRPQISSAGCAGWSFRMTMPPDAERRSKDSANRDFATLRAALNLAFRSGLAALESAWRKSGFGSKARSGSSTWQYCQKLFKCCTPSRRTGKDGSGRRRSMQSCKIGGHVLAHLGFDRARSLPALSASLGDAGSVSRASRQPFRKFHDQSWVGWCYPIMYVACL